LGQYLWEDPFYFDEAYILECPEGTLMVNMVDIYRY